MTVLLTQGFNPGKVEVKGYRALAQIPLRLKPHMLLYMVLRLQFWVNNIIPTTAHTI